MPGESAIVREDHRIADRAIVADVTVSEKISAIANARFAIAFGAAIDRAKFAERIFVANFQIGRFAPVFLILRLLADRSGGLKFIFPPGSPRSAPRAIRLLP